MRKTKINLPPLEDAVVRTKQIVKGKDGEDVILVERHLICAICGHDNPITATSCKMCGNIFNPKVREEKEIIWKK